MAFPAVFNLADLDGSNGFVIRGVTSALLSIVGVDAGKSVSDAGDVNGDGIDDIIIGAPDYDTFSTFGFITTIGRSYVVFGSDAGFPAQLNLTSLNGNNGFGIIVNLNEVGNFGDSVSSAGDFNGDGIDDVIIGSPDNGASYVVFGSDRGFFTTFNLSLNDFEGSIPLFLPDEDRFGKSVSSAGDFNGDGFDDIIIGAPYGEANKTNQGESYVLFGSSDNFDFTNLDGSNGFVIRGLDEYDLLGFSVSDAGDLNGDGLDDIIIGASRAEANKISQGESYVVFGNTNGFDGNLNLKNLNGSNGFVIRGIDEYDSAGLSVSAAGDVNGDGFDDIIIGGLGAEANKTNQGESYVVFGSSDSFAAELELDSLDGSNGFVIRGVSEDDFSGESVSGAGDVNGDGFDDIIIGAPRAELNQDRQGESYVVFGSRDGFAADLELNNLDGSNGFVIRGLNTNDISGISVSDAGDVNSDGIDDIIIGAPGVDSAIGESYVIFGVAAEQLPVGTNNDDLLNGTNSNETFAGLAGNDTINGGGGNDVIRGNGGRDRLNGNNGNDTINGGGGNDVIRGNGGRDRLNGNNGKDIINGGGGNDKLTGGNNSDKFIFSTGSVFNTANLGIDRITDFSVGQDIIGLSQDTFTALDNQSNGRLRNSDFEVVTNNIDATTSNAEIVYNSSNGRLFYNENNSTNGFGSGGLFAIVEGSPNNLSNGDFEIFDV